MTKTMTVLALVSVAAITESAYAQETPHYEVMAEYIRQLGTTKDLQEQSSKEFKTSSNKMMDVIRGSTRIKLELNRNIYTFKAMKLDPPYETLLPSVVDMYEKKMGLHDDLIKIASQFIGGPKPNVDYDKLAATIPQISATLEYLDKTLYSATPMFCFLLVDQNKVNSKGNLDHLLITKAQRKQLIQTLNNVFGPTLTAKDQNYTIESASLINTFLMKDYKGSDEP